MVEITSLQNPKIKQAIKLRDRRTRDETGLFLIEGYRELLRAVEGKAEILELFTCKELFLGTNEDALIHRIPGDHYTCAERVFRKLSYRDRPDGLIGIAKQPKNGIEELAAFLTRVKSPFLVIAEGIEKPGNLGTILRSCDASGADALIVCDACTDLFNPNVVRASVGTLFTVPTFNCLSAELIPLLKKLAIKVLAATPQAEKVHTEVNLDQSVAIAMGTEQLGLSDQWMEEADLQVRIPMHGNADSLNVAMATTILLYEVERQRRSKC